MTFFIEWQVKGYEAVVAKKETREEMRDYISFLEEGGTEILGIWKGEKWHLHDDGKIYNFKSFDKKAKDIEQNLRETPGC